LAKAAANGVHGARGARRTNRAARVRSAAPLLLQARAATAARGIAMSTMPRLAARAATLVALALSPSLARAQSPGAATPAPIPTAGATWSVPSERETCRLHVDTSDPATIWARGDTWKASFAAAGFVFTPFLGSQAPRNFPLQLQLAGASVGGVAVPIEPHHGPRLRGERVELERGACTEVYALTVAHVEQLFVFAQPLGDGDLTVHMHVATELAATPLADGGVRFANERGGVHYGRAVAIDAQSRRVDVSTRCEGGALTLTVPAAFVAAASFPLTIDPVVSAFVVGAGSGTVADWSSPDCAYVGTHAGLYAAVFEEAFSQTDHDVYLRPFARDGAALPGQYVDYTSLYWAAPQIASHRGASQFLVVAARGLPSAGTEIWARTVSYSVPGGAAVLTLGNQFAVYTSGNGSNPDVGGDPNPSPPFPGNYCVTWENAGELYYRIVGTDTSLQPAQWLDPGQEYCSNPRIGKSCGVGAYTTQEWILVWQKRYSPTDEDVFGSIVGVDGSLRQLQFTIDYSSYSDTNPEVSSETDYTDGAERFLVTYERLYPSTIVTPLRTGLRASLWTGTTSLSGSIDLSALLQASGLRDQMRPSVDTDGVRFAVGYDEWSPLFSQNRAPFLATVHVAGTGIGVTSYPELVHGYTGDDAGLQVTSERSGGSFTPRYMAVWTQTSATPTTSVAGSFYYGHSNLAPASYFNQALPACGSLALTASGLPALGNTFFLDFAGVQGVPFLLLGQSVAATAVCPGCFLGVDAATMLALATTSHAITVPPSSNLIGVQIATQGLDLLAPGACSVPVAFSLSNAIVVTIL
jgi:hypothetical protein